MLQARLEHKLNNTINMKKVALPSKENMVDGHFGHCDYFTVFTINSDNSIADKEVVASPNGCGCKSNIAGVLSEKGVGTMLAGNIGPGAVNVLANHGIKVHTGYSGEVETVLHSFLNGVAGSSTANCNHTHEDGHSCNH